MTTSEFIYAPEEYDAIARAGCESLVFHPGKVAAYDLEGYERVDHQPVEPGGYPYFNEPQAEQQEDSFWIGNGEPPGKLRWSYEECTTTSHENSF